jgi:caffeoyl-CoA O-methyltransferase
VSYQQLEQYVNEVFAAEDDALRHIQAETQRHELPQISLRPHEGQALYMLARLIGARKIVEIGVLAGYSGTWLARALPADGRLIGVELSAKHAEVARANFAHAGLSDKVEIRQGAALDLLASVSADGPFDLVFIDADKGSYPEYLAWAVDNLRPGGVVAAHNAFRHGSVVQPQTDEDRLVDGFNRSLANDPRLDSTIFALGDGMAVAIKRA